MMQPSGSIDAQFSITWTHRLRFTTDAFSSGASLDALFSELQPLKFLPIVDSGIESENKPYMQSLHGWLDAKKDCACAPVIVTGGEGAKNDMLVVNQILEAIHMNNICRRSCVLVIGGGAVLDAVGYASSIAHRGIPIIRMPSTTLSQCDSGVGVKNGVNHFDKKNFIGVFDPPFAVINDDSLLQSLDDRHWRSGLSEVVKVALVKDADFFTQIETVADTLMQRDSFAMSQVIKKSAILHLEHITNGGDPFERLDARPLDFGHWAAHKLEQLTGNELTHGEAVSIGLAIDIRCSVQLGLLDEAVAIRAINLLHTLGLPTSHPSIVNPALLEGIEEFRQHLGGRLTLLMLAGIAKPINVHALDPEIVRQAIDELL
ncbi:MAG: 3-dehydroquinate synthase [Planctomycetes bacterium]|nr:3-dehydroquinate synthase [Planctomycetota bacterium]